MALFQNDEVIVIDDDSDSDVLPELNFDDINSFDDGADTTRDGMDQPSNNHVPLDISPINCKDSVRAVFADICPDYLEKLASEYENNSDVIIDVILNAQDKGESYPRQPTKNPLKRKRVHGNDDDDGDEDVDDVKSEDDVAKDIRAKISEPDYHRNTTNPSYKKIAPKLLAVEYVIAHRLSFYHLHLPFGFPKVHMATIRTYVTENAGSVFKAHAAMNDAVNNCKANQSPWPEKRMPTPLMLEYKREMIGHLNMDQYTEFEQLAIAELRAARDLADFKQEKAELETEEKNNFDHAKSTGQTEECGCCFEECAINRMIYCDGEKTHRFCRDCMRSQVETNIGLSKHELTCMSMDGCSAGFTQTQRKSFLDKKTLMALERLEFEASLRMAGIEDLETCPFCPYAAEYPSPEVNKEFRCDNPDCEKVSCRLCRKESHIPLTCEENAVDHGLSARHVLEEAMSEALIRKCNKCQHPYVKLDGCNKVMCTRCRTLQCYVCRATITSYQHFNDTSRGGREGQCPLYDRTEQRHEEEVRQAEQNARNMVEKENPGLTADALNFKVSDQVKEDEERQRLRPAQRRIIDGPRRRPVNPGDLGPRRIYPDPVRLPFIGPLIRDGRAIPRVEVRENNAGHAQFIRAIEEMQYEEARNRELRRIHHVGPGDYGPVNPGEGIPMRPVIGRGNPPLRMPIVPHDANPHRGDPAARRENFPRIRNLVRNANPQPAPQLNQFDINE